MTVNQVSWLALYVKSRHEKQVALSLRSKGLEAFLPTYFKEHAQSKTYELPLFPGYVFCRANISQTVDIRSTPAVFTIVGNAEGPSPIPDEQIAQVQSVTKLCPQRQPWSNLPVGSEIKMTSGLFRGVSGVVVDIRQEKWLVVSISLLGRSVAAKLDRASVLASAVSPETTALSQVPADSGCVPSQT